MNHNFSFIIIMRRSRRLTALQALQALFNISDSESQLEGSEDEECGDRGVAGDIEEDADPAGEEWKTMEPSKLCLIIPIIPIPIPITIKKNQNNEATMPFFRTPWASTFEGFPFLLDVAKEILSKVREVLLILVM